MYAFSGPVGLKSHRVISCFFNRYDLLAFFLLLQPRTRE